MTLNFDVKKDRLRYTKNTSSSTQAYIAIIFNVLYFISIYHKDVAEYYYTNTIGFSVICNLLFLLGSFLCSEGVKNYKMGYSIAFIPLGVFQIIRIFGIPMNAYNAVVPNNGALTQVMDDAQFIWVCICLLCSALACFATAITGIIKTHTLREYEKSIS